MGIKEKLEKIKRDIPENVTLLAVSKTKPADDIMQAYNAGHRVFGENKAQELINKQPELPDDIQWHFIGHLQRNKVKYIAPFVSLIEGVDSLRLLREINKQANKNDRIINCLLQFHIASEESKFGLSIQEAKELIENPDFNNFKNINIRGVMGMATFTDKEELLRKEFSLLRKIFKELKQEYFLQKDDFTEISMGMSGDYPIAIDEGSTIVRVGTAIFGERNYA